MQHALEALILVKMSKKQPKYAKNLSEP